MERTKEALRTLFDEMTEHVQYFNRKYYEPVFEDAVHQHMDVITAIARHCEEAEDKEAVMDELAGVLPQYVAGKLKGLSKRERGNKAMDYNMTIALFVIPMINYSQDPYCDRVTDLLVEKWNGEKVTGLNIGKADYEKIRSGFKKKWCYITTAVCESQNKPDDCHELTVLRDYRDHYLLKTKEGRKIVEEYYDVAPVIVLAIGMQDCPEKIYKHIYEQYLAPCVRLAESGENEACRKLYTDMVETLQRKYLYS